MRRLVLGGALVLGMLGAWVGPALAWGNRGPAAPGNQFAMTPPPVLTFPRPVHPNHFDRSHHHHHFQRRTHSGPVYVPGYWADQWVPTAYTTYVWVPGYITADGSWLGGYYQPQVVTGGYYRRVWVGGY